MPFMAAGGSRSTFGLDPEIQEKLVQKKLAEFSWDNPLGVSTFVHYAIVVYAPVLVIFTVISNIFSGWVLESTFLKDLVVQPLLKTLLNLNNVILISGPLYVWFVQTCAFYITGEQIFHCFLLNTLHNFSLLSSSFLLMLIVLERAMAIGRPQHIWMNRRNAYTRLGTFLIQISLVMSIAELYALNADSVKPDKKYPICVPWWENEHASAVWFKILAIVYSLIPAVTIVVGILLLEICSARYTMLRRMEQDSLTEYQALLLELSTTVHFKFVNSASALGIAFIILCTPVGLFILLIPALQGRASGIGVPMDLTNRTILALQAGANIATEGLNGDVTSVTPLVTTAGPPFGMVDYHTGNRKVLTLLEFRYTLVSRTDTETLMWFLRYTFCGLVVPILLGTEILFAREWKGRLRQVLNTLCFWRSSKNVSWLTCLCSTDKHIPGAIPGDQQNSITEGQSGDAGATGQETPVMAGPYIARIVGQDIGAEPVSGRGNGKGGAESNRTIRQEESIRDKIQVFDASKPARAGRRIDRLSIQQRPNDSSATGPQNYLQRKDGGGQQLQNTRGPIRQGPPTPSQTWHAYLAPSPNPGQRQGQGQGQTPLPLSPAPPPGAWSTIALYRLPIEETGQTSNVARPGSDFGKSPRMTTSAVTTPTLGRAATPSAATATRPHPGPPLPPGKMISGIPVMTVPAQIWDYQLLTHLASTDNRKRNIIAPLVDDGVEASALTPDVGSFTLPARSTIAEEGVHPRSRPSPQQQHVQQQQQQGRQARPAGILKPLSTDSTPRATRREQDRKERERKREYDKQ